MHVVCGIVFIVIWLHIYVVGKSEMLMHTGIPERYIVLLPKYIFNTWWAIFISTYYTLYCYLKNRGSMALFSSLNPNSKIFLSKGLKLKMIFLKGFYLNDEGHPNISKVYQISYAYFVEIGLGNKNSMW